MEPENLQTIREYEIYIQSLKDFKRTINDELDKNIDFYEYMKKFCDDINSNKIKLQDLFE